MFRTTYGTVFHIMCGCVVVVNYRRHAEQLPMIQATIGHWSGPDLVETSSVHLHDGTMQKISGGKCQERVFYLFDNLMVYCKRTVLGQLVLKGRIPTDQLVPRP